MVNFNYDPTSKVFAVAFIGRMDTLTVQKISEVIQTNFSETKIETDDKIIFDLKEVDYISSAFIRICVSIAKQVGSRRFFIENAQPFVVKTFKLSGLEDILNVN